MFDAVLNTALKLPRISLTEEPSFEHFQFNFLYTNKFQ